MVTQVFWLVFTYALVGTLAGVLFETGNAPAAAAVMILVPAVRIWRRFRPGKGYYLPSFVGEPGALRDRSIRVTPQVQRSLFLVMVGLELAIVTFVCFRVLHNADIFGGSDAETPP